MKGIFLRLSSRFLKEKSALWVWFQTKEVLKEFGVDSSEVWPICFVKGNLTLGSQDGFFIAKLKAREKEFLKKLNLRLGSPNVKKVFYRFSSPHGHDPTLEER